MTLSGVLEGTGAPACGAAPGDTAGTHVFFCRVPSAFGPLLVVQGPHGVVRLAFPEESDDLALGDAAAALGSRPRESASEMVGTRDALDAYLQGEPGHPDIPVDLSLVTGPFRRRALERLRDSVDYGQVVTYGALAARAGRPGAARAAGSACARNPVPLLVPCHRVLPGSGGVGAYGGGSAVKRALLALEGVQPVG